MKNGETTRIVRYGDSAYMGALPLQPVIRRHEADAEHDKLSALFPCNDGGEAGAHEHSKQLDTRTAGLCPWSAGRDP